MLIPVYVGICLWVVSVYEYLCLSIVSKRGVLQEMFNVLVDSIKTSTEVQKQVAQSNYELVKNCNQMLTSATNMLNVVVNKLDASAAGASAAGASAAGASAAGASKTSKKAAGAQRGKRKVIVMLDGEEKEVLHISICIYE